MSTFRAQVRVDDGMLQTSRPLTAPEQVADMIESVIYSMREAAGGDVLSVDVTIETRGSSDTPVGDSVAGTSSEPLPQNDPQPVPDGGGGSDTPIGDSVIVDGTGATVGGADSGATVEQPATPAVPGQPA